MRKFLATGLVVLAAAPLIAFGAPHHPKIERIQSTVNCADDEWKAIPLSVEAGDLVFVEASGRCLIGSWTGRVSSDGEIGKPGQPRGNGTLTMKVGDAGSIPVGSHFFLSASEAAALKLRVADTRYSANSGELTVVVTVVPSDMLPKLPELKDATASGDAK